MVHACAQRAPWRRRRSLSAAPTKKGPSKRALIAQPDYCRNAELTALFARGDQLVEELLAFFARRDDSAQTGQKILIG